MEAQRRLRGRGRARGAALELPRGATHAMIFIEGNHVIEQSGLLDGRLDAYGQTLNSLRLPPTSSSARWRG